jgi:hypothetical protein
MPNEPREPDATTKKKREIEVRDLNPKKDTKGGAAEKENQTPPRTGEVDFMKGLN